MGHEVDGHTTPPPLDAQTAGDVAAVMHALATPSRVLILGELRREPRSVGTLAAELGMTQAAVSQQLRVLRHLGLVVSERDGRRVIYDLHDEHVGVLLDEAIRHMQHVRLGPARRISTRAAPAA